MRQGFQSVFALTTQTMDWFKERGYVEAHNITQRWRNTVLIPMHPEVDPSGLPPERLAVLEKGRGSKVYRKWLQPGTEPGAA